MRHGEGLEEIRTTSPTVSPRVRAQGTYGGRSAGASDSEPKEEPEEDSQDQVGSLVMVWQGDSEGSAGRCAVRPLSGQRGVNQEGALNQAVMLVTRQQKQNPTN